MAVESGVGPLLNQQRQQVRAFYVIYVSRVDSTLPLACRTFYAAAAAHRQELQHCHRCLVSALVPFAEEAEERKRTAALTKQEST